MAGTANDMISQAERSLGLGESPAGSNRNYISAWYGLVGPWCDMSISYWAAHSGNATVVGHFAYTVSHAEWFRARGQWHTDVAGIRRGDIVFFDWNGSNSIGAIDHVGLVTGTSGGAVLTIEGNSANVCARRVRYSDTIVGFGRPAYANAPVPAPPSPPAGKRYEPFPGVTFFRAGNRSPIIARAHARLVVVGCNRYESSSNKDVWGSGDVASYAAWQRKRGFTGADANGIPGKSSWDDLRVPLS